MVETMHTDQNSKIKKTCSTITRVEQRRTLQNPYTWILQCFKIFKVANNIGNVIEKSMKNW